MNEVWGWREAIQASALHSTTRLVLFNLSFYMNSKGGSCFPSVETQATDTGLSKRAVITHLQIACDLGFLKKTVHQFSSALGKGWKKSGYIATYPDGLSLKKEPLSPVVVECYGGEPDSPPNDESRLPLDTSRLLSRPMVVNVVHPNSPIKRDKIAKNKNTRGKSDLLSLAQWEEKMGSQLRIEMLADWVRQKNFDQEKIEKLIETFRLEMQSKDKKYADFKATFQVWVNNGYMKVTPEQLISKRKSNVEFYDKGIRP